MTRWFGAAVTRLTIVMFVQTLRSGWEFERANRFWPEFETARVFELYSCFFILLSHGLLEVHRRGRCWT